jgi:hypothetical protein
MSIYVHLSHSLSPLLISDRPILFRLSQFTLIDVLHELNASTLVKNMNLVRILWKMYIYVHLSHSLSPLLISDRPILFRRSKFTLIDLLHELNASTPVGTMYLVRI